MALSKPVMESASSGRAIRFSGVEEDHVRFCVQAGLDLTQTPGSEEHTRLVDVFNQCLRGHVSKRVEQCLAEFPDEGKNFAMSTLVVDK